MTASQTTPEKATVRLDGVAVDPCSVIAGSHAEAPAEHHIEIQIEAKILLHELQQFGVEVSEQTLREFVATDARDERARDAYLMITRCIVAPLPQQKLSLGILRPRNPARHTLAPRWKWTETADVQFRDNTIIFSGSASDV